jgi:hypothetical protein
MDDLTHGTAAPSPCFTLLSAIATALEIPAPATAADQARFYRLRSARADHALAAIRAATDDARDLQLSAKILLDMLGGYPVTYANLGTTP